MSAEDESPPRARGLLKRWALRLLKGVLGLLALVVLLVLGAFIALQTRGGRAFLLDKLAPTLSTAIPGKITIRSIDEARIGQLTVRDIVISDPDGHEVIRVGEARVRPDFGALLRGVVDLDSVRAKDVLVHVRLTERGTLSLVDTFVDDAPTDPDPSSAIEVFVRAIRIDRGRVVLHVVDDPPIELRDVAIRGSVTVTESVQIKVDDLRMRGVRGDAPLLRTRAFHGVYRNAPGASSALVADLRGDRDVVRFDADARNPSEGAPLTETSVRARLELAPLTSRLLAAFDLEALEPSVPKRISADISLSGSFERARLTGRVSVDEQALVLEGTYRAGGESRAQICTEGADLTRFSGVLPVLRIAGCYAVAMGVYSAEQTPFTVHVRDAALDDTALPDIVLSTRVSMTRSEVEIVSLVLPNVPVTTPPRIALRGHVTFDGAGDLTLATHGLRVTDDPALTALVGPIRGSLDTMLEVHLEAPATEGAPMPMRAGLDATVHGLAASGTRAQEIHVVAHANGTTADPRFDLRGDVKALATSGFRAEHVSLHAHGSSTSITLDVRGDLPRGKGLTAHAVARESGSVWRGALQAHAGTPDDTWHAVLEDVAYDTRSGAARIRTARISHRESKVEASIGMTGQGGLAIEARIETLKIHDLLRALAMPIAGFTSSLSGTATITGTTRIPVVHAELTLDDTTYADVQDIRAHIVLDYGRTNARIASTLEIGAENKVSLAGTATWSTPLPPAKVLEVAALDLTLDVERLALQALDGLSPSMAGLSGDLTGTVSMKGLASSPTIEVDLSAETLVVPGVPVTRPLEAGLEARWEDALEATLTTEDEHGALLGATVRMDAPSSALTTGALVLSELPWTVSVELAERPTATLPLDLESLRDQALALTAHANVQHDPGRPLSADVTARLYGAPPSDRPVPSGCEAVGRTEITVDGKLENGNTRVDVDLSVEARRTARITFSATTPVDAWLSGEAAPALDARLEGTLEEVELGALPLVCAYAHGALDGTITAERLGVPGTRIAAHLASPALHFADDAPVSLEADVTVVEPTVEARVVLEARDGGSGNVEVTMPFTFGAGGMAPGLPDGPLSVRARFDDLSLEPVAGLGLFIRRRAGTIDGHIGVAGTLNNPTPSGEIRIHDASLMMPGLDQRLTDLEAHVSLSPTRIVVHTFEARDVRGTLSLTGEAAFENNVPNRLEAEIEANTFPVRQEGVIIAEVTSRAKLELVREEHALRGELELRRLDVRMPDSMQTSVQPLDTNPDIVYLDSYPAGWDPPEVIEEEEAVATSEVDDESPFVPTYFHVDLSNPFWIRRTDFAIELDAELDLGVVEEGVRLSGTVHTRRGFIELLGTSFDIEDGTVRFPGGTNIDPVIDLSAVANAGRENEVHVRIKGTIATLVLTFTDRNARELTAGLAVQCITTSQCAELGALSSGGNEGQAAAQQAQNALASLTVGLLTTAARHGLGDAVPRIGVTSGGGFEAVTARVGFEANRLIPKFLRSIVLGLYIEGFISTESDGDEARAEVQEGGSQVSGGFLFELRHPRRLVTRGRVAPRSGWSLDITWQR